MEVSTSSRRAASASQAPALFSVHQGQWKPAIKHIQPWLAQQRPITAPVYRRIVKGSEFRRPEVLVSDSRQAIFFVDATSGEEFNLPLETAQLLGLKPGTLHKDSDVNQAFDELVKIPLEPGYSPQISHGREEVLQTARTAIITAKRTPLDQRAVDTNLPMEMLPGCLALLAELGHSDLVLGLGTDILATDELDNYPTTKSDVLLSMALAKCNQAREEFANGTQVASGCRLLEDALQLLTPKGIPAVAPELAREVRTSLTQLAGQCALEQLAGPVSKDKAEDRRRALRTIRERLPKHDVDTQGMTVEFVGKLMPLLTCDEVVHLQEWSTIARHTTSYKWVFPGLLDHVAVGHIILGYQQCQPAYIKMALQLLKQLPVSSEVLVAQAVCQLLLGSVHSSLELLRQAEVAGTKPVRPSGSAIDTSSTSGLWGHHALSYVQDHTPAGEDGLLPGLCQYTQVWLATLAAPQFREAEGAAPLVSLTKYFDNTRVEALITVYDEKGGARLADSLQGVVDNLKQGIQSARTTLEATGTTNPVKLPPTLPDLSFVSDLPRAFKVPGSGVVPVAAAVGMIALALVAWHRGQQAAPSTTITSTTTAITTTATRIAPTKQQADTSAQLDDKTVEQMIKTWKEVKADALGPSHDVSRLPEVLCEPELSGMRQQVADFKKEGMYIKFKTKRVKVKDIDTSQSDRVQVVAMVDEYGALHSTSGALIDAYDRPYDSKYEFVKVKGGEWRLSRCSAEQDK